MWAFDGSTRSAMSEDVVLSSTANDRQASLLQFDPITQKADQHYLLGSLKEVIQQLAVATRSGITESNDQNSLDEQANSSPLMEDLRISTPLRANSPSSQHRTPTVDEAIGCVKQLGERELLQYAIAATKAIVEYVAHATEENVVTPKTSHHSNHNRNFGTYVPPRVTSGQATPVNQNRRGSSPQRSPASAPLMFSIRRSTLPNLNMFAASVMPTDQGMDRSRHEASTVLTNQLLKEELDGFKMVNQYMILQELGRGQYGKVKLAADTKREDKLVAIKVIPRAKVRNQYFADATEGAKSNGQKGSGGKLSQAMLREVAIMKKLKHPNIVRLLEVIDDPEAAKLYLVMQCVSRGPLLNIDSRGRCEPIEMGAARRYIRQLCAALHYLQQKKIAHRDIKPENILLGDNGRVYLSDFGVSDWLNDADPDGTVAGAQGTLAFMAPEVVRGDAKHDGHAADIWSLGVTFYTMVYGRLPFHGTVHSEIANSILKSEPSYIGINEEELLGIDQGSDKSELDSMSSPRVPLSPLAFGDASENSELDMRRLMDFEDLVRQMLVKDPASRITLRGIANHAFFKDTSSGPMSTTFAKPMVPDAFGSVLTADGSSLDAPGALPKTPAPPGEDVLPSKQAPRGGATALDGKKSGSDTKEEKKKDSCDDLGDGQPSPKTLKRLSLVKPHLSST